MCGIAGVVRPRASAQAVSGVLDRMLPGIATRGPDGTGRLCVPGVGLLHTRLAIIDLTTGDQPMWNEMRTVACVFNGEIYNYRELTRRLEGRHRFATTSDTEVLVHLYEEHGEALVEHLHGMYAFALWDEPRRRVLLGRDRLGIKPLYYARTEGGLAFASSIEPLLAAGASSEPDPEGLALLLRLNKVPEPRTAYRSVRALPPSHLAVIDVDGDAATVQPRRFHSLRRPPREGTGDARAARRAFEQAVATHLVADVEVAAFLSGGIDSSLVVAQAQRLAARPLRTFCVAFRGAGSHDESEHAARVASAIGTRHETIDVSTAPVDALRDAVQAAQQPFAVTSFVPLLLLCRAASRQVKVVLTGDGGDEVGFGYPWYRWMRAASRLPASLHTPAADRLRSLERRARANALRRGLKLGRGVLRGAAAGADSWRYEQTSEEAVALLRPEHRPSAPPPSPFEDAWESDLEPVEALRRADLEALLRDEMLPKLDRAGMAHGLEGRVPLLDDGFVDAMLAIPARVHMRDPRGKALLREWARELVPACDVQRPKHGFDVPIAAWLQDGLAPEVGRLLLEGRPHGLVDPGAARALLERVRAGVVGAAQSLYAALMAAWWFEAKGFSR